MKPVSLEYLLLDLKARDIRVWLEGERLRVSAPEGSLSTAQKEELSQRKAELVEFLHIAKRSSSDERAPPLVSVPRNADLPLSFDQQRLWYLHQMNPHECAYNLQSIALIRIRPELLQKALNELNCRHEILRTCYQMKNAIPVQVIHAPQTLELPLIDLSALSVDEKWQEIKRYVKQTIDTPFDLENGPVWRAQIYNLGKGIAGLVLSIHHIASDGWSLNHLVAEIRSLCQAWEKGNDPELESLPLQYADYAQWQRQYLQGDTLGALLDYWRKRLADMPEVLELPIDFSRPAVQTTNGAVLGIDIPKETLDGIQQLAQKHQVTLFMAMLAVFKVLLFRYTSQEDIVVGTPIAGRDRHEIRNVQGMFVNNLVLRTDMSGDPSFVELLQRVRETTLGAYCHNNLPFEKLVEHLRPRRSLSHNPLFQVMFNQLILPPPSDVFQELGIDNDSALLDGMKSYAQQDLGVLLQVKPDRTSLVFNYSSDLFERATIERMAGHYLKLAESVLQNPLSGISELPMLSSVENDLLLREWNRTEQHYPEFTVSRLFEMQVERFPDNTALVFEGQSLTYAELNARANRLANYLQSLGVGAEVKVGLFVERGFDMIVSILAVLKTGGAYVPLDPAYPVERLAFMLEDSQVSVIVSQLELLDSLPTHNANAICLDRDEQSIVERSDSNLALTPSRGDLAYVIYTSGSTGVPKGVEVPNSALANLLQSMIKDPGMSQDDVLVAITTLAFDMAVPELYLPLVTGATMVIASREVATDGVALGKLLDSCGASIFQATPSTWRLLFASGWGGNKKLKALCGAEPMPPELADQLLERCDIVWNTYGPTETTVWSTAYRLATGAPKTLIGRPIANTRIYILDNKMQPVAIGVTGELYIGGSGVTRGYWQRPELTAERFIPDPFSTVKDQRMYKTGDLARYRPDGNIEYIGRIDHQVKLRGFRIELGEVEAALARQDEVRSSVVIVREDTPGDQRLVAYVIRNQNCADTANEDKLRNSLSEFLPGYMIPSFFILMDAFPLTPTGKIDRKALPVPKARQRSISGYIQPETEIEKTLAAIWCEMLGVDHVSLDDNFFDIGGHSLIAIKSIIQFREQTGLVLEPVSYYQQTLGQLAASVDKTVRNKPDARTATSIQLEPVFFGNDSRRLFGLTRIPPEARGSGIVLCSSFAHEYIRCHRAMRELALRLARAGFHVFTFDYYGTGDSAGEYHEARLHEWQGDLDTAIDTFKQRAGIDSVCLLGMRLGASLAMLAAEKRKDIDAIALWDPIISGAEIEPELSAIQKNQSLNVLQQRDIERSDVLAYRLTDEMKHDMESIDLYKINVLHARHMFVLEMNAEGHGKMLARKQEASHAKVDYVCMPEAGVWMREPYESIVPQQSINALVDWMSGCFNV